MADTKITALAAIATVDPAADVLPIVDISDTSMAASGTTKKITSNQILGSGGTATLASATITGAATVGTTLGVTGQSTLTGSVGIGGSPTAITRLYVRTALATDRGFASDNGLNADFVVQYASGLTTIGAELNVPLAFKTNNIERMRLTGGNLSLANGNVVMTTSGTGIDFSAVTGGTGTATANVLNDYEEGVFDAFFITGGGTVTINPAINQCRYTKIGRLVTVQGSVIVSSVSSPTGPLLISGLPYTIATGAEGNAYSAMSVFPSGLETTATGQIVGYGVVGSVSIYMYRYELGTLIGLAPSAKTGSEFTFSMTYSI